MSEAKQQLEYEKELLAKMEALPNRAGKHRIVASQKLKIKKLQESLKPKRKPKAEPKPEPKKEEESESCDD